MPAAMKAGSMTSPSKPARSRYRRPNARRCIYMRLDAEAPLRVLQAVVLRRLSIGSLIRIIHRLQPETLGTKRFSSALPLPLPSQIPVAHPVCR